MNIDSQQMEHMKEQELIVSSLAKTYACLYYIDFPGKTYTSYYNNVPSVEKFIPKRGDLCASFESFCKYLCAPEASEMVREFIDADTLNERMAKRNKMSLQFKGATIAWGEVSFLVCDRLEDGSLKHLIMGIRDISEQKEEELRKEKELKESIEANKSKIAMLQNLTHEIRTPLNAMFGFSQLLSLPDGSLSDQEKIEYFNYIYNSFNMLSMLIDDVLDMADSEHGNYRIVIGTTNVNDVCRTAMQMAEVRKKDPVNMYFTTDLEDGETIESDGRRIQQVLVNYLVNACKHTDEGEIHLHVSKTETPGRLTFSVTDTGEGVPPEMAKDIFERYKKLNANVQGSGLGLNICSVIAEKLNGKVELDTTYSGGARFIFVV